MTASKPLVILKETIVAGESKTITFTISAADVSFINAQNKRVTEEGKFDVLVGNLKKEFSYQQ